MNPLTLVRLLTFGFFLTFTSFNAAQSLAGSIPAPAGLAPIQFMALYITFALACISAPKAVVHLGPRVSMGLGVVPYLGLIISFLAPPPCGAGAAGAAADGGGGNDVCWPVEAIWVLRLGFGLLVGLGAPLVWTGQGVYLAQLAARAAAADGPAGTALLNSERDSDLLGLRLKRYNGIFFTAFQFSGATGLVASSLVLSLVTSSAAINILFIGLSACAAGGLLVLVLCLPSLPATGGAADGAGAAEEAIPKVSIYATIELCMTDARMYLIAPNILYNGLSLAFIWYLFNSFGWNTTLGASFVGFGSASFYLSNSLATSLSSALAERVGQLPVMSVATVSHTLFFALAYLWRLSPLTCMPDGCATNTSTASCWKLDDPAAASFPFNCHANGTSACAQCVPYNAHRGHECAVGWKQCQWLHGDAAPPRTADVVVLFVGATLFALGDAVWESQVPAVLQVLFDADSGHQPAAMANLKFWQSLGIGVMFGLANFDELQLGALVCLVTLGLSSASLAYMHVRIASLDTGRRRSPCRDGAIDRARD